jgi:hypothetical protein
MESTARILQYSTSLAASLPIEVRASPMQPRRPYVPRSYVVTDKVAGVERIFDDAVSICIWRRGPNLEIQEYLSNLRLDRAIERVEQLQADRPTFEPLLRDLPQLPALSCIRAELQRLTELFATLSDCHSIGVRFAVTRAALCPRFHVDRVGLRLICTWQGAATEWLEHQSVNRRQLGAAAQGVCDEKSGLLAAGAQIHRMRAFDVGLFKGELWPNNAGRGAIHRSPAPDPDDQWRAMVSLEALD